MVYATPICSALLLRFLGIESLTCNLLGAVMIVIAGMLSRTAYRRGVFFR